MIKYLIIILLAISALTATVVEISVTEQVEGLQLAISEQQEVLISSLGNPTTTREVLEGSVVTSQATLPQQETPSVYTTSIPVVSPSIQSIAITSSKPITIMESQEIKPVPMPMTHVEQPQIAATPVAEIKKYIPPTMEFIVEGHSDPIEVSAGDKITLSWKAEGQSPLRCKLDDESVNQIGSKEIVAGEESFTISIACVDVRTGDKLKKQVYITVK